MNVIYLTPTQADIVRGESSPGYCIEPIPYVGGFILPLSILTDPAHAAHHEFLNSCLIIKYIPDEEIDSV